MVEVLQEGLIASILLMTLESVRYCAAAQHILVLNAQLTHEVGRQVLDLHGVSNIQVRVDTISTIRRVLLFKDQLLALIIFLCELHQVHLLEYLKVHIDEALTEQRAIQQVDEIVLPQLLLEQIEDLAQLKRESMLVVLREAQLASI